MILHTKNMPSSDNTNNITVIQPNSTIWPLSLADLWKWREAFYRLILKEFQVRFQETYLGFIWVLLQPLLALAIFMVVLAGQQNLGTSDIPYSVYLLSGLIFWTFISNGFVQGGSSLYDNQRLIIQTNLKRSLIPLSVITSKLIDLTIGICFLLVWIAFDPRVSLSLRFFMLPLDIFGMFIALVGISFFFSALCINYKDIRYTMPFLAQVLFFATPILYVMPATKASWILYANPFTIFVLSVRDHLFGSHFVNTLDYLLGFVLVSIIFVIGGAVFRKFESSFADII